MLQVLSFVEEELKKHWSDHEGFVNLQERLLALRMILEESGTSGGPKGLWKEKLIVKVVF